MSIRTWGMSEEVRSYLLSVSLREHDALQRLRAETKPMRWGGMQISAEQGQLMALLVQLLGARRTFEVGTFTGYSALVVALALPPDGRVVACDVSEEWTSIGKRYWQEAGVADKIDLRIGPGLDTLDAMIKGGETGSYDFAFVDADKNNYDGYYERALVLLRKGGLVAFDNVLWGGKVLDETKTDEDTVALRALNRKLHADERVSLSMLPVGDGLTLAMKR